MIFEGQVVPFVIDESEDSLVIPSRQNAVVDNNPDSLFFCHCTKRPSTTTSLAGSYIRTSTTDSIVNHEMSASTPAPATPPGFYDVRDSPNEESGAEQYALSDSDELELDDTFIPWDWLVTERAVEAMDKKVNVPVSLKKTKPPPKKKKDPSTGKWRYFEYIPEWTDPDFDDKWEFFPGEEKMRPKVGDVFHNLRPALLLRDTLFNPTEYAKRYGINPDASQGRSRTSPTFSQTRRVGLGALHQTYTGEKDYITGEDLAKAEIDFITKFPEGMEHGKTLRDFLAGPDGQQADPVLAAYGTLYDMNEDDKDYQRWLFTNFTTDEVRFPPLGGRRFPMRSSLTQHLVDRAASPLGVGHARRGRSGSTPSRVSYGTVYVCQRQLGNFL